MPSPKVIVFGPTGQIASIAALTAHHSGATVCLGMRDPSKPIPNLDQHQLQRIQADLTKPPTLTAAVTSTSSTHAFLYLVHTTPDFMRASLEALKSAGITFVVFLSSYSIAGHGTHPNLLESHPLSFAHAQVERNLKEVFGEGGHVAVRAGYLASNSLLWKSGGEDVDCDLRVPLPKARFDFVSPGDVGAVCGRILARGPGFVEGVGVNSGGDGVKGEVVEVVGPEMLSHLEAAELVAKVVGNGMRAVEAEAQDTVDRLVGAGRPEAVARYMVRLLEMRERREDGMYLEPGLSLAVENLERVLGRPGTRFEDWVVENKGLFVS